MSLSERVLIGTAAPPRFQLTSAVLQQAEDDESCSDSLSSALFWGMPSFLQLTIRAENWVRERTLGLVTECATSRLTDAGAGEMTGWRHLPLEVKKVSQHSRHLHGEERTSAFRILSVTEKKILGGCSGGKYGSSEVQTLSHHWMSRHSFSFSREQQAKQCNFVTKQPIAAANPMQKLWARSKHVLATCYQG